LKAYLTLLTPSHSDIITKLVTFNSGKVLVSTGHDQELKFWTYDEPSNEGTLIVDVPTMHESHVNDMVKDGERLVTISDDGTIKMFWLYF